MLVKHNLLLNGDKLIMPDVGVPTDDVKFVDDKIYFKNITNYIAQLTDKEVVENVDDSSNYFVGVYGELNGYVQMFTGKSYETPQINNKLYYLSVKGSSLWLPLHLRGYEGQPNSGVIQALFVYKDNAPDLYLPNINTLPKEKRGFLPPEGNYKEITPL